MCAWYMCRKYLPAARKRPNFAGGKLHIVKSILSRKHNPSGKSLALARSTLGKN